MATFKEMIASVRGNLTRDEVALGLRRRIIDDTFGGADTAGPDRTSKNTREPEAPGSTKTLHPAVDLYLEAFDQKSLSDAHKLRTRQLLAELKKYRFDVSIADIDRLWLETLANEIKSRPVARKRKKPLSPHTVRNLLQAWSQFFDWLDANGDSSRFGNWQAPRRWKELFAVRVTELMTKAERDANADGPRHLTLDQVIQVYRAARNDSHRIWILLGLFAGLGQREIASLRRDEFDLAGGLLTHRRNKTGQRGQAWLPPELVAMNPRLRNLPRTGRYGRRGRTSRRC